MAGGGWASDGGGAGGAIGTATGAGAWGTAETTGGGTGTGAGAGAGAAMTAGAGAGLAAAAGAAVMAGARAGAGAGAAAGAATAAFSSRAGSAAGAGLLCSGGMPTGRSGGPKIIMRPLKVGLDALAAGRPDSVSGISSMRLGRRRFCASAVNETPSATVATKPISTRENTSRLTMAGKDTTRRVCLLLTAASG
jgi:hypothetical protein